MARIVKHETLNFDQFKARLSKDGWSQIGGGAFGEAWAKGSLVWKFERPNCNQYSAWARYIQAVARGEFSGPHVPRVRIVLILANGSVAALMERLVQTVRHYAASTPNKGNLDDVVSITLTRSSQYLHRAAQNGPIYAWQGPTSNNKVPPTVLSKFLLALGITKSFLVFAKRLKAWAKDFDFHLDVHGANIMLRADGTLVVTDPVS